MNKPNLPTTLWTNPKNGQKMYFVWHSETDITKLMPAKQSYGICFNQLGQIVLQRSDPDSNWSLPGGTIELNEDPISTLKREFLEEVDIEIQNINLLGGQTVQLPDSPASKPEFYQLRYYCEVADILPQTPDPDDGKIRERKFFAQDEVESVLNWKETGHAIIGEALAIWNKLHPQ